MALTRQSEETGLALSAAKDALIGYAVSYPDKVNPNFGPGYLPCPDITNNGSAGGSCSLDNTNSPITSIGRFPYKTLESEDLRDNHGERLWYVVSDNFRNNPKMIPLNSETASNTSGDLTVNGYGDIAAVIFVADAPENNQNRTLANVNDYTHYIEATFTDIDSDAYIDIIITADTDRYILLTKDELMQAVEKRVNGEVSQILTAYNAEHGAYPWLSPFADPKTIEKRLTGEHSGGNDQTTNLTDSSADFTQWGVANGDVVWNITDGSYGVVSGVTATVLTIGSLSLGNENDFDKNDEYFIDVAPSTVFVGSATVGSSNLDLKDSTKDFKALGVEVGDIVDIDDGSSGIIEEVLTTELTVKALTGTGDNTFDDNDNYRVRTSLGQTTSAGGLTLNDTNVDFTIMGIHAGDLLRNITDGSYGRISVGGVAANSLTVDELQLGINNSFSINDYYVLPRFNSTINIRQGHLGFYEVGEFLESGFNISWGALESDGATVSINTTGSYSDYDDSIKQFVQTSSETLGAVNVDVGSCVWRSAKIVECRGSYIHASMQGTVTSGVGSGANSFTDNTKHFINMGVNPGDIILNYDDEFSLITGTAEAGSSGTTLIDTGAFTSITQSDRYNLIVRNDDLTGKAQGVLSEIIDTGTIKVIDYDGANVPVTFSGGDDYTIFAAQRMVIRYVIDSDTVSVNQLTSDSPDLDTGEFYGIKSATAKTTSRTIDFDGGLTLNNVGANFVTKGIQAGDIVHNITDDAWGEIATVDNENRLTVTQMYASDGSTRVFNGGESYEIYYSYVNTRRYKFALRFSGLPIVQGVDGIRKRDVCLGYTNCTGTPTNVSLPYYDLGIFSTTTAGSAGLTLNDTTTNFLRYGVVQGDTVINITDGSNGIIDTVSTNQITVFSLAGGTNVFSSGDSFRISRPMVTVEDYDKDNNLVGSATVTIPSAGTQGSINVTGLDYGLDLLGIDLNNDGDYNDPGDIQPDIPAWFIENKWHQLIYIAYSAGDSPNGEAVCDPDPDNDPNTDDSECLTLTGGGDPNNNKRAMVIIAGEETNTNLDASCNLIDPDDSVTAMQDRSTGLINAYYEGETCSEDDKYGVLDKPPPSSLDNLDITNRFNDQIRVLGTSP